MTEEARCTCLDRARIALEQTGQHWCAGVMGQLQIEFDKAAYEFGLDSNRPLEILDHLRVLQIIARCFMEIESCYGRVSYKTIDEGKGKWDTDWEDCEP